MLDLVPVHSSGMVITRVGDETGIGLPLGTGLGSGEGGSSALSSVASIWIQTAGGVSSTVEGLAFQNKSMNTQIIVSFKHAKPLDKHPCSAGARSTQIFERAM